MSTLNVSWINFALRASVVFIVPAFATVVESRNEFSGLFRGIAWSMAISAYCFFAFGWARIRRASRLNPIMVTDRERIIRLLIGPAFPAVAWFLATALLPAVFAVAWVLYTHAA